MINQKGQAFSVFELMIAGVVAFAILMVLMQVIGGILTGQDTDALSALSDAVKSASPSGQAYAGSFVLQKDLAVRVTNLASETDLDPSSFIFVSGEFASDATIEIADEGKGITYTGSSPKKKIAAMVICEQTSQDMSDALDALSNGTNGSKYDLTLNGECVDGIVCCVIIPTKATK